MNDTTTTAGSTTHAPSEHDHSGGEHHGPSLRLLLGIFIALMILTGLTVGVTSFDFGYNLNLAVALAIALAKGTLVGLFFMHLRWDPPIFGYALFVSLMFVVLFIAFAMLDTSELLPQVQQVATQQAGG